MTDDFSDYHAEVERAFEQDNDQDDVQNDVRTSWTLSNLFAPLSLLYGCFFVDIDYHSVNPFVTLALGLPCFYFYFLGVQKFSTQTKLVTYALLPIMGYGIYQKLKSFNSST